MGSSPGKFLKLDPLKCNFLHSLDKLVDRKGLLRVKSIFH